MAYHFRKALAFVCLSIHSFRWSDPWENSLRTASIETWLLASMLLRGGSFCVKTKGLNKLNYLFKFWMKQFFPFQAPHPSSPPSLFPKTYATFLPKRASLGRCFSRVADGCRCTKLSRYAGAWGIQFDIYRWVEKADFFTTLMHHCIHWKAHMTNS